ncbi:MAG: large conductance mechanosensitive channel [Thermomicrobiales bacterium]|jgi:large conductance mechanosensitive channel|nr:large conductance mechanosensitive channel [Thermomicrobiales bacterium]MEA2583002.1 large conductance mechanosensitive channel [Thermomicrobiales bacterium]
MLKDFRNFLMRGNIVDLAVAVVIGAAFGAVVTSLTDDILMPIIGIFGGSPDFSANTFTINGSEFRWGNFVTAIISFVIVAAAIFFLVVKPMNALMERIKRGEAPAAEEVLPPTWEYRSAPEGDINRLGAEGWELVGVSGVAFHLKRPLTS